MCKLHCKNYHFGNFTEPPFLVAFFVINIMKKTVTSRVLLGNFWAWGLKSKRTVLYVKQ